jgi:predicted phage tail component-like protein
MGLSFNGVHTDTLGIIVKMYSFPALPTFRNHLIDMPGRSGSWDFGAEFGSRTFEIPCVLVATDRADMVSKIRDLARTFNPTKGLKKFVFDEVPDIYYMGRIVEPIDVAQTYITGEFVLKIVVPDAFGYTDSQIEATFGASNIMNLTANVTGDLETSPVIEIYGKCGSLVIENLTSGMSLTFSSSLISGDYLVIDMPKLTVVRNNSINALPDITVGDFWELRLGLNSLRVTSGYAYDSSTLVRVKWSNKYL